MIRRLQRWWQASGLSRVGSDSGDKTRFFVGTGDNVYFDVPNAKAYNRSIEQGKYTSPARHGGQEVLTEMGMRKKYHEQFAQPRFIELFASVPTYWEKGDHDYRVNECDPHIDFPSSHTLGVRNFRE